MEKKISHLIKALLKINNPTKIYPKEIKLIIKMILIHQLILQIIIINHITNQIIKKDRFMWIKIIKTKFFILII